MLNGLLHKFKYFYLSFLQNRLRKYSENAFSLHAMCKYIQNISKTHFICMSRKLDKLPSILELRRSVHLHYLTYTTVMICCSYNARENVMTVRVYTCVEFDGVNPSCCLVQCLHSILYPPPNWGLCRV